MAALNQDVGRCNYGSNTPQSTWLAAATQVFYKGSIVIKKADGFAYVGVAYNNADGQCLGVAAYALDTTGLLDGATNVILDPGTWGEFDNSAIAVIAEDDRGKLCYVENDGTVSLTDQSTTLTIAGRVYDIADDGTTVVVQFEVIR